MTNESQGGVDRSPPTLGPVRDPTAHLRPDWWRHMFGAMYLKTDGDVVDDAAITRREVDSVVEILQLKTTDRILDLCCGQGRHALELARRAYAGVEGLDQSHYLLSHARETAKREQLAVKFHEGDARDFGEMNGFDAVLIMGNSFGYSDADDDLRVLRNVRRALRSGAKVFLDIADGEWLRRTFEPRSWEWVDAKLLVCRERWLVPDGRLVSREVVTDTSKGVIADQFYAERLYSRDDLAASFKRAGFSQFTIHAEVATSSERNQDLGMMAHRLFVTAVAAEVQSDLQAVVKNGVHAEPAAPPRPRDLVVVLGDPGKPDRVKPGGSFGSADLDAIARMKEAFGERAGRRVRYLSNHDDLLAALQRLERVDMVDRVDLHKGAPLVVNLCDEGYCNHPHRELHVPALLEALDLSYTGAGPACLARCLDKGLVRGLARELGIPVARGIVLVPGDAIPALVWPVIAKPNHGDGSFGIDERCVANDASELARAVALVREIAGPRALVLVEELLTGAELGVGILGNPPGSHRVLPIVEEDFSVLPDGVPRICSYRAKWDPSSPYWHLRSIPAVLPDATREKISAWSLRLFSRLECRDYARFDWRLDAEGTPHLLEVNPNPGWCWDGHLAKMAALAGISYAGLLEAVIDAAEERLARVS